MQIHNLSENNSVLNHFLGQIRNVNIHKDSMRFRRNIERIGEIMAYELSKEHYKSVEIQTLRYKNTTEIADQLVICSILRAGFPCTLVLNYFDAAQNGFISASDTTIPITMITLKSVLNTSYC
jgi:uracil phosphoribosyltransferase